MPVCYWTLLARPVACGEPVLIRARGVSRQGVVRLLRVLADGGCHLRFADDSTIDLPRLKELDL